jgi:BMFP domain-containing protein YqiC|tara:strand:- start:176 stop:424 length:249 start_codon:yes stop_codon:yes gene_type:complete
MSNTSKILKLVSSLVENGILTSQDAKKEILNNLKFKRDDLINKLQIVSREEFNVLKKIVMKHEANFNKLKKNNKFSKKVKKS